MDRDVTPICSECLTSHEMKYHTQPGEPLQVRYFGATIVSDNNRILGHIYKLFHTYTPWPKELNTINKPVLT